MSDVRMVLKWPMHARVESFQMPAGAVVIDVREQNDVPTLWTLSNADATITVTRTFLIFMTGHAILEPDLVYVGSAHGIEGALVFHIFERPA